MTCKLEQLSKQLLNAVMMLTVPMLLEIMIPLINDCKELEILRANAEKVIQESFEKYDRKLKYKVGTMIELPRAAITADQVAPHADFFSFGTNDLTQTTFGLSEMIQVSFFLIM